MKVVAFKDEHIELAELSGHDIDEFLKPELREMINKHLGSVAGTFLVDGRIVCIAGLTSEGGIGYPWLIPTTYFYNNFIGVAKSLFKYEKVYKRLFKLKKLVTSGHDDPKVIRWLKWCGFKEIHDETWDKAWDKAWVKEY